MILTVAILFITYTGFAMWCNLRDFRRLKKSLKEHIDDCRNQREAQLATNEIADQNFKTIQDNFNGFQKQIKAVDSKISKQNQQHQHEINTIKKLRQASIVTSQRKPTNYKLDSIEQRVRNSTPKQSIPRKQTTTGNHKTTQKHSK